MMFAFAATVVVATTVAVAAVFVFLVVGSDNAYSKYTGMC